MNGEVKVNFLKPRWSKVFSDVWGDKTRTALVVTSIAAGVLVIGMLISAYVILGEDINRSYAAINPPNIVVWTDPFDDDLVSVIADVPGVEETQGRRFIGVRARQGAEDWRDLTLVAVSDFKSGINLLTPIEGAEVAGKGEALITQDMMHISGFHVGGKIEIELPDGSNHFLTVAGLVSDQTTATPNPSGTNIAFITLKTLKSFGQQDYFNRLYVTVEGEGNNAEWIACVASDVEDKIEKSQRQVQRLDQHLSNKHPMTDMLLAMLGILGALGGLIIVLGSSLIINTLNALLAQQRRQIGVMKLIGARSTQILGMYLTLIVAYSLIALIISVPLGALAGYGLAWFMAYMLGAVVQGFRIIPGAIVVQVLVAILVPLGAGFFPVNSGARTSVQQAISDYRPGGRSAKSGFLTRNAAWFRWISRPLLLSFRNTFRKKGRLLLTLFTLTVAGAVFIGVFNVRDAMSDMLDQVLQHFKGDVTVDLLHPYRVSKVEQTLLEIPGIERVEGWTSAAGEVWDQDDHLVTKISIIAPPQDTQLLDLKLAAGRWLLPHEQGAIVVSDTIYKFYPDLRPGDSLIVKLPGRKEEEWKVVGLFQFVAMFGDPMAYANFEFVAERNHLANQATSFRIITKAHDADAQKVVAQRVESTLADKNFAVRSVQPGYLLQERAALAINTLLIFLLIMAVLIAFVGSIGLTGTMSINVLERTREIGVMRTIGAVDLVIMRSVIVEGLVIGLLTWLLAIGLAFPVSFLLLKIIGKAMMDSTLALTFTPFGILLWLGVVIVLVVFASLLPARKAARLTINEVLAYE